MKAVYKADDRRGVTAPAKLDRNWYCASDGYGVMQTAIHLGPLLLLLALATPLWRWGGPAAVAMLILPVGVLTYKLTIILHDCAHMTLFRTRRYNRPVGRLVGFMLGTDFIQFQVQHFLHHRAFGQAIDPQGPDYLGLQTAPRRRILWHLLRPLTGFNLFKLLAFRPPSTAEKQTPSAGAVGFRKLRFLAGMSGAQLAIAMIATQGGSVWWNILLFPFAAATVSLFLSQLRGFCEHVTPVAADDESFVRTHQPNLLDRIFFYGLNFNFHVEHHLYPAVPSRLLPDLHEALRSQIHSTETLSPSILQTARTRLAQCPR